MLISGILNPLLLKLLIWEIILVFKLFTYIIISNNIPFTRIRLLYPLNYEGIYRKFVDLRGVEPRPVPCHGTVLPLYYRPCFSCNAAFCRIYYNLSLKFFQTYFELTRFQGRGSSVVERYPEEVGVGCSIHPRGTLRIK